MFDLLLECIRCKRYADTAGHRTADPDQQTVPLVFEVDAFSLDLTVLFDAFLHHRFECFEGDGKIAALKFLQYEFILASAVAEKHQQAVQAEQQQDARAYACDYFTGCGFRRQQVCDQPDDIFAEKYLRYQTGACSDEQQARKGDKNTV